MINQSRHGKFLEVCRAHSADEALTLISVFFCSQATPGRAKTSFSEPLPLSGSPASSSKMGLHSMDPEVALQTPGLCQRA